MKKIFVIMLLIAVVLLAAGCSSSTVMKEEDISESGDKFSMFVEVESGPHWKIFYDRETLCMYVMSEGSYNFGTFALLVNSDGTPKLWEDK